MFLIMGMKVKLKAIGDGTFHCPRCGGDRTYRLLQARRWFTVFFVPVIPLKELGTVVQCDSCSGQFSEAALQAPTATDLATTGVEAMRAAAFAFLVLRDTPAAAQAMMRAVRNAGLTGYGDADLTWDRQTRADEHLDERVRAIGPALEPLGRERFLEGCLHVGLADGDLTTEGVALAQRVGAALGLTRANVDGVVAHVTAAARPQN